MFDVKIKQKSRLSRSFRPPCLFLVPNILIPDSSGTGSWYLFSGILPVQISRTCVIGIADLCGACLVWHVRFHNVFPMTPSVSEPFANRRRSPVFMTQQITSAAASVMWSVCRGVLLTGTHFTNRLGYFTFWISLFAQRICCVYSHASRSNFILIVVGIY